MVSSDHEELPVKFRKDTVLTVDDDFIMYIHTTPIKENIYYYVAAISAIYSDGYRNYNDRWHLYESNLTSYEISSQEEWALAVMRGYYA